MDVEAFIEKYAGGKGGTERAVYQMFLTELAHMLGVSTPNMPVQGVLDDYQFEAPVKSEAVFGSKGTQRIDLYKRDHFILEAKQSQLKEGESLPTEPATDPLEPVYDLFGNLTGYANTTGKRAPRYDRLMTDARIQAERYSLGLRDGHKAPPFLIVADIGRAFELYFDWTGDGRGYGFFPDQQNYRIAFEDLRDEKVRDLFRGIWSDIPSVDPRLKAAAVTSDVATRLSRVAEALEKTERQLNPGKADTELAMGIEATSLFLMRTLFCMFAEDVSLLPEKSFTAFLDESRSKSDLWWRNGLNDLWTKMNQADQLNRFWSYGDAIVRHFNGNLFSSARVYDLPQEFKGELYEAARKDWKNVEPAIFGTLLEQVLTSSERAKLGAHYTPRPYVQRIVNATIGDVLTPEWQTMRDAARLCVDAGQNDQAIAHIRNFHARLCGLRILDPACGTGNFLYVGMELLLQLEGEAIQLATELGATLAPAIHPNQFLGLELNPRAAVIAELVLWIGWLRHRLANHPQAIGDPVLPTLTNINQGTHGGYDAVLRRTATGEPDTANPMMPEWPEADFIIGNPPFIGKGSMMRAALGNNYVEALTKANPRVSKSADFVMQWWDRAAHTLVAENSPLIRFGFVTTNSITQTFNRRVLSSYLDNHSLSLVMAVPDHPWTKATKDAAAVRIAMTVAKRGEGEGTLIEVTKESGLDTDKPVIEVTERQSTIHADLSVGADVTSAVSLKANDGLSCNGMMLAGQGFKVTRADASELIRRDGEAAKAVVRPYLSGSELLQKRIDAYVIDFCGLSEKQARQLYPASYQHLLKTVKPERDKSSDKAFREKWWLFGRVRPEIRATNEGIARYIVTTETAKHRVFQFLSTEVVPDHMIIAIGSDDAFHLGVLSSGVHVEWAMMSGAWLGIGNDSRYSKSKCFDPFPFPDATPAQRATIAELAEELDTTRKLALDEAPGLTMTEIYNLRDKLRSDVTLNLADQDRARAARAGIINRLHEEIDWAVSEAYGWTKGREPNILLPSEIMTRLVALNAARTAEEAEGTIRWLRPDYQIPRFAKA